MRETVFEAMSLEEVQKANQSKWLTNTELKIYVDELGRTGFQGGPNRYRAAVNPQYTRDRDIFAGRKSRYHYSSLSE